MNVWTNSGIVRSFYYVFAQVIRKYILCCHDLCLMLSYYLGDFVQFCLLLIFTAFMHCKCFEHCSIHNHFFFLAQNQFNSIIHNRCFKHCWRVLTLKNLQRWQLKMYYIFESKIAFHGYHVYRERIWPMSKTVIGSK